jgi:hypothetical protein
MLPQSYPNYKTVHRRFQAWCRDEILRRLLTDVANELRDGCALDEEECFIDATFVMAKGGRAEIGATKRGKGMKIMAIVVSNARPRRSSSICVPCSTSTVHARPSSLRCVELPVTSAGLVPICRNSDTYRRLRETHGEIALADEDRARPGRSRALAFAPEAKGLRAQLGDAPAAPALSSAWRRIRLQLSDAPSWAVYVRSGSRTRSWKS